MTGFPLPPFVAPPAWTIALFVAVVGSVVACAVLAIARSSGRRAAIIAGVIALLWLALTALVPMSGILAHDSAPPRAMIFFAACTSAAIALALSPIGARVSTLPVAALVAFHSFRLPLEIVLERWAAAGTIPIQMSFHGDNFDVVTGALAIVVAPILAWRRVRWLEIAFHLVGLGLLVRVAAIATMSAPGPLRTYDGIVLQLPFHAPYAWIVSVCVAGALAGHVVGLRAAMRERVLSSPA